MLVGVVFPTPPSPRPRPASTSWPCWWTRPAPTWWSGSCSAGTRPTRPPSGPGQGRGAPPLCRTVDADTVVFDDELSPAQQRNLEKILGRTAIDRTAVILDIFAQNARTPEGQAQVELALLRYRLPRLRGRGRSLSQQAGGIGTRGPGETQLEVDRRRLVRRMSRLEARPPPAGADPAHPAAGPGPFPPAVGLPGRLHQRREVDPAQPADRRRRRSSRTGCSRPSTPGPASWPCPAARRSC